jgi:hypothetical protein
MHVNELPEIEESFIYRMPKFLLLELLVGVKIPLFMWYPTDPYANPITILCNHLDHYDSEKFAIY